MTAPKPQFYRVKISGTLLCKSNLHIGDGTEQPMEDKRGEHPDVQHKLKHFIEDAEKRPLYNRFVRNAQGKLYAPGSTLRGALRQSSAITEALFGKKDTSDSTQQQGGVVRIYDARITVPDSVKPLAYWHPADKTGLHAGVVIDPKTGTAEDGLLYQHEVIPAGSKIHFKAEMDWVDQQQIDDLLEALQWWDGDLMHGMAARKSKAWGLLKWKKDKLRIKTLGFEAMAEWLESVGEKPQWEETECDPKPEKTGNNITLVCQQPLLVNEPGRIKKKNNNEVLPDHTMYRQGDGKYAIPAQTLIGTLRSIARRIFLTQLNLKGWENDHNKTADDFIESIFGSTAHISKIRCSNLVAETVTLHKQCFIAIDRFTGGVVDGKLYTAEALPPKTTLSGQLHLPDTLKPEQKGLLYLVLRELQQGSWIGWGKSKGYGLITLVENCNSRKILGFKNETEVQYAIDCMNKSCGIVPETPYKKSTTKSVNTKQTYISKNKTIPIPPRTVMNDQFYNPYSFIPVKNIYSENTNNIVTLNKLNKIDATKNTYRHDLYLPDCHSGKITCNLTTTTDTLVGNQHEKQDNGSTIVHAYRHKDKIAFPANSLRGMIGNNIEVLSQSSLRILEDKDLVERIPNGESHGRTKGILNKDNEKLFVTTNNNKKYEVTQKARLFAKLCNTGSGKNFQNVDCKINFKNPNSQKVWFRLNDDDEMIELSGSLRRPFEHSGTYSAFSKIDNKDSTHLLPWGRKERKSNFLTPAELMLGIVAEDATDEQFNFASRLQFTDAICTTKINRACEEDHHLLLKILDSPKLPSKYLYFHKANNKEPFIPNGRKQYLRQHPKGFNKDNYRTWDTAGKKDQKCNCNPVLKNQEFTFDIHFSNLNDKELKLLLTAIEPSNDFYHKLGLGKPLGLGTVEVKIIDIKINDIEKQYLQAKNQTKEIDATTLSEELIDPETKQLLINIGKLQSPEDTITYPLVSTQLTSYLRQEANSEKKLYLWHSKNKGSFLFNGKSHERLSGAHTTIVNSGASKKKQSEVIQTSPSPINKVLNLSGLIKTDGSEKCFLELDNCDKTPEYETSDIFDQYQNLCKEAQESKTSIPVIIQAKIKNKYKIIIEKIERK